MNDNYGRPSTRRSAVFCLFVAFALLVPLLVVGCGYRITTGDSIGRADASPSVTRMVVGSVDDRSREPLFGALVRQGLARRGFSRSDVVIVDSSAKELDGVYELSVELGKLWEDGRASTVDGGSHEYLLRGSADATLKLAGETVWVGRNITARREFARGEDVDAIVFNKDRALKLLADDLAGEIMRRALLGSRKLGK